MQFLWTYVTTTFLLLTGLFLILIVLLQRGRGGGLAGAFGGMGGQSAFGTKAGDVFTWITIGTACVWVLFAIVTAFAMRSDAQGLYGGGEEAAVPEAESPVDGGSLQGVPQEEADREPAQQPQPTPSSKADESGQSDSTGGTKESPADGIRAEESGGAGSATGDEGGGASEEE